MEATATNTKETSTMSKPVIYHSAYSSANLYTRGNKIIRQATITELLASNAAAKIDGGFGWIFIDVDGTRIMVCAA
jgi:hypothetical protein